MTETTIRPARPTVTRQEWAAQITVLREAIGQEPEAHARLVALCGGEDVLNALFDPRGVGIGRFAALMGLPTTTVRHLLREGLLHPVQVNGKFSFFLPNVIELRGVQQWQALGLTLEETRDFLEAQALVGMVLPQGGGLVTVSQTDACPTPAQMDDLRATALARIREANARLAAKHAALTRQLEQARALEDAVAALKIGGAATPTP